jgi:C4-dicarboxylate transporter, DctM subunit
MAIDEGGFAALGEIVFGKLNIYLLVAIPLFTLMAHFMIRGRIVDDLYGTAHTLLRHLPGGLGVATVAACTIFAAISGSSVATALTIGAVAIPQMIRYGYSDARLRRRRRRRHARHPDPAIGADGALCRGRRRLDRAAVHGRRPAGADDAALFAIYCMVSHDWFASEPRQAPAARQRGEMVTAVKRSFWALSLPVFVLGGMYMGVFTATEAAAAGALAALVVATLVYRSLGSGTSGSRPWTPRAPRR